MKKLMMHSETVVFLNRLWESFYTGDYLSGAAATQILTELSDQLSYVDEEVLIFEVCGEE